MRKLLVALSFVVLAGCDAKALQPDASKSDADRSVAASLATGRMLFREGDYADAVQSMDPVVAPDVLDRLSPELGHEVISLYADAAWYGDDYVKAHWAYKVATQSSLASSQDWLGRLMSATVASDPADAYVAFDHLRLAAPDQIRSINQRLIVYIDDDFGVLPNAPQARLQLAQVLLPLKETDPRADFSPIWLQAATTALERGDKDAAMTFARRISNPLVMARLRADRRFDVLVTSDPGALDVRALGEAELANAKALAAAEPGRLAPQYAVASALYRLGRYPEALNALDAALAAGPAYGEDPSYNVDLVARKVTVLSELGRNDEALAITSAMCAVCTRKSRFDMQQAHLLIGMQRFDEALATLDRWKPPGLDVAGVAELAAMRACALHGVGRRADAAAQLDFLRQHERDDPDADLGALVCAGSDDQIAAALVATLDDPQMRASALGVLQVYREGQMPPLTKALRAKLSAIAARPDVQAELAKVGRVEIYDMPRYAVVG